MNGKNSLLHSFINKVTKQIRSKSAQHLIEQELINHIEERGNAYQKNGFTKEEADKKVIQQMGNPISLGKEMDRVHRPKIDNVLIFLFITIVTLSLVPMYTLSLTIDGLFIKKVIFSLIAVVIVICLVLFDYRKIEKFDISLYISAIVMMLCISFIGWDFRGQTMLHIGNVPRVDFFFTLLLLYLAWASILQHSNKYRSGMLYFLFWLPILLYIWNGYYFYSVIYLITILVLMNIADVKKYKQFTWITLVVVIVLSAVLFSNASTYQRERVAAFLHPEQYKSTLNYYSTVSREMLANAGWVGQGNNYEQISKLPETSTDMVFPYLIYVFGWGGGLLLTVVLIFFVIRIVQVAKKVEHLFGKLIIVGGLTIFLISLITNILISFGFLPFFRVSLPFISYGGTQLIFYSIIVGLNLSISYRNF